MDLGKPSTTTIAVDGPVASGKTVVGRLLARRLGYRFLDTGLMYRALTWAALNAGVDPEDSAGVVRMARKQRMEMVFDRNGEASVRVGQSDVTPHLSEPEIDESVSLVARVAGVREVLVGQQRHIAREGPVVMAGRDIGTVVLPDAPLKVFLTASAAERARRRHTELRGSGRDVSYQQVLKEIEERDRLDSEREVAPLRPAPDAYITETDNLTIVQAVEWILELMGRQ